MKNYVFKKSSDAGFSLLEVLVVMIIMGILAALAAPGWVSFVNRQHARTARDQVQQAIRSTQTEAKRLRRRRSIQFYDAANSTADGVPQIELNERGFRDTLGSGDIEDGAIDLEVFDANGTAIPELIFRADGSLSVEANDYDVAPPELPITLSISAPAGSDTKRCLHIETLLASIDMAENDDCNP
jgi:prepilin-type N-terminal cleavage/methylation domain-containing protein